MRFAVGSTVWAVVFDDRAYRFRPSRVGVVLRVRPGAFEVSRGTGKPEWLGENTFPLFGDNGEADAWCETHLPLVPTISRRAEARA